MALYAMASFFHVRAQNGSGTWGDPMQFIVHIDSHKPRPVLKAARMGSHHKMALRLVIADPKPSCGLANVTVQILRCRHIVKTLRLGALGTNETLTRTFHCVLHKGQYTCRVFATDIAGNRQSRVGATRLIVR